MARHESRTLKRWFSRISDIKMSGHKITFHSASCSFLSLPILPWLSVPGTPAKLSRPSIWRNCITNNTWKLRTTRQFMTKILLSILCSSLKHVASILAILRYNLKTAKSVEIQGGSNMTGTDLCVNNCKQSRSYLNHLVYCEEQWLQKNFSSEIEGYW